MMSAFSAAAAEPPDWVAEEAEQTWRLVHAFRGLPQREAVAIRMRYVDEATYRAIGDAFGLTFKSTVPILTA